ncbi:MAG: hypothetical protein ABWZ25_17265 [Chitinophagaceae bacterium]
MVKKFLTLLLSCWAFQGSSQVTVSLQLPPAGLLLKSQLWNMIATNASASGNWVHIELLLSGIAGNEPVLSATSATFLLPPGSQQLQVSNLSPIQYVTIDPSYQAVATGEFLPVGQFLACYSVVVHGGDAIERIWEECELIEVEPLSPVQLLYPYNQTAVETLVPTFNWIPPSPLSLFSNLFYEIEVVEILPGQTESDAIQQNIPIFSVSSLATPFYPYPASAPSLEYGKNYAWRVTVKNGISPVSLSEVWAFTPKQFNERDSTISMVAPFAKLRKDDLMAYGIALGNLRFDYFNETADTVWNLKVLDITQAKNSVINLPMDSIPLKRGQNLITISLEPLGFVDKHIYLLEIANSRNEVWRLRFEYRKNEETSIEF